MNLNKENPESRKENDKAPNPGTPGNENDIRTDARQPEETPEETPEPGLRNEEEAATPQPVEARHDGPTPPPVHREFETEEEWARTLHIDFDAEEAAKAARRDAATVPPPVAASQGHPGAMPPYLGNPSAAGGYPPPYGTPGQPGAPGTAPRGPEPMPPTYLVWAILATLCCCLPAGVVAIVFSASVSSKYFRRDYEGARRASRNAEIWIIVSIVAGILSNALYLPLSLLLPS